MVLMEWQLIALQILDARIDSALDELDNLGFPRNHPSVTNITTQVSRSEPEKQLIFDELNALIREIEAEQGEPEGMFIDQPPEEEDIPESASPIAGVRDFRVFPHFINSDEDIPRVVERLLDLVRERRSEILPGERMVLVMERDGRPIIYVLSANFTGELQQIIETDLSLVVDVGEETGSDPDTILAIRDQEATMGIGFITPRGRAGFSFSGNFFQHFNETRIDLSSLQIYTEDQLKAGRMDLTNCIIFTLRKAMDDGFRISKRLISKIEKEIGFIMIEMYDIYSPNS